MQRRRLPHLRPPPHLRPLLRPRLRSHLPAPRGERQVQISRSSEVAYAITTAFAVLHNGQRGCRDPHFHEELEVAQVRYKHALRRLKRAYPGELCDWTEHAPERMYEWALMWEAAGHPIPAAAAAAHVLRINLQKAAAALVQRATPHFVWSVQSLGLDI